jgi:hypothetical protein
MAYTVSSGGVTIGETELGFVRTGGPDRSGWFHPTAEGEAMLAAWRATQPRWSGPDWPGLTLHRADGSIVRTESIGIQDMVRLLAMAEWEEARREAAPWDPEADALDAELEADAMGFETDPFDGDPLALDPDQEPDVPWAPDDEPADMPRYQIHLRLADERAIP